MVMETATSAAEGDSGESDNDDVAEPVAKKPKKDKAGLDFFFAPPVQKYASRI